MTNKQPSMNNYKDQTASLRYFYDWVGGAPSLS